MEIAHDVPIVKSFRALRKQLHIVPIAGLGWKIIRRLGVARIMKNMAERYAMVQKNAKSVLVAATSANVIFMKK